MANISWKSCIKYATATPKLGYRASETEQLEGGYASSSTDTCLAEAFCCPYAKDANLTITYDALFLSSISRLTMSS